MLSYSNKLDIWYLMILGADTSRFSTLQKSLEDRVLLSHDEYPTTVIAAYELLQNTCPTTKPGRFHKFRKNNKFRMGTLSFAQIGNKTLTPGVDGQTHPNVKCYKCHEEGHYCSQCPTSRQVTLIQFVF